MRSLTKALARTTTRHAADKAILAAVLLCVGVTGAALTPTGERRDTVAPRHARQADCLWLAARNHGFYALQEAVVADTSGDATRHALWRDFVESIGADECGHSAGDLRGLTRALARTRGDAERHFAAGR